MNNMPLIEIKDVSKKYLKGDQNIVVFEEFSLNIPRGDFIAIMGPSGSGKTTLLNLLGGIDKPSTGTIYFNQKRIDNSTENELAKWRSENVGFIFQLYNLMPMLSAAKNVELPLLLTNMDQEERNKRVSSALELVNLIDRLEHYPKEMSGGQQQRVAIARAIVSNPQLLLCDEPTGDLDRKTANDVLDILKLLNKQMGKTIIMVTHDYEASCYANKVLHLDKGKFVEKDII
jgi:putative ABC transport system ATP-binding protein